MPSSIKLTEPLDILVEYGYLDEDKPYHKALNNAVMDFAEDPSLGGEYNKDYVMLLQNEAKKELKLRRKKIDVSKFFGKKEENQTTAADTTGTSSLAVRSKTGKIDTKKFIPEPTDENQEGGASGPVKDILSSVVSIEETLNSQYQLQLEGAKEQKEETEKKRRGLREKMLEGSGKVWDGIKSTGEKVIKPFQSIWSRILGFISTIFFGRIFYKIIEWMGDKENQGKIQSIIKFFKDWWPTLLAAYLLFGNAFGKMAVKLGVMVGKFAINLLKNIIPKLISGLAKMKMGKAGMIGGALLAAGGTAYMMTRGGGEDKSVEPGESAEQQTTTTGSTEEVQKMNKGGTVPGSGNTDTVPAMLTPGEFVMSKGAVQKYGVNTMESMNAAAGGTNRPTMGRYSGGGKAAGLDKSHFGTEGYRMGQILPEQLYYNFDKYTSSYKTKDGEVVEDKDELIELSGAIGMPDLIEHQTQLVDSIRKVEGYEDINFMDVVQYPDNRGRLVGMPQETLYPIFNASDAWKASDAKRDAAIAMDAGQSFNPTQTAKSVGLKGGGLVSNNNVTNATQSFTHGGLVQYLNNGGRVRSTNQNTTMQMGNVVSGNMSQSNAEKLKREIELEEAEDRAMMIYGIDSPEYNEVQKQKLILAGTPAEAIYTDKNGEVKVKGYSTFDGKDKKSNSGGGLGRLIGGAANMISGGGGLDFKNKQVKSAPKSPDISPPSSSSSSSVGAKITSLKMDGNNNPINLNQDEAPPEVPDFSATVMRSRDKIKTLGIMV